MVQWLGLHAFIARFQVQSLARELRPCKPCSMAKKKKEQNPENKTKNTQTEPRPMKLNSSHQDHRQGLAKSEFEPRAALTPVSRLLIEGNSNPLQYSRLENPHGQRSLVGIRPWGRKESDMTKLLTQQTLSVTAWELSALSPHLTHGCFSLLITVKNNHHVKENFKS